MFTVVVVSLVLAQMAWPRRASRPWRNLVPNVAVFATNTILVRLFSASSLLGVSAFAEARGLGLLNAVALPAGVALALGVVALDFGMYVQHRLFHWSAWLWRFHAVHHSDTTFDLTTGIRFHPVEMVVSLAIKMLFVLLLGASPLAVLIFEVLLSSASLFSHSNVRLPLGPDGVLRWLIVTPDMHRIHHSILPAEHNRNFGFLISAWDRAFGSYARQPGAGHESMVIGLDGFRSGDEQTYSALMAQPFKPDQA